MTEPDQVREGPHDAAPDEDPEQHIGPEIEEIEPDLWWDETSGQWTDDPGLPNTEES